MNNITILHISDFHLKNERDAERIRKNFELLQNAIRNHLKEESLLLITLTGDFAYSGNMKQFDFFSETINDFIIKVESNKNLKVYAFAIPGNHDCNFESETNIVRSIVIDSLLNKKNMFSNEVVNTITRPLENYFKFEKNILINNLDDWRFYKSSEIEYQGINLIIHHINTAILSDIKEQAGQLRLPINLIKEYLTKKEDAINICIAHHPSWWLTPEDRREYVDFLQDTMQLVLTGHEHVGGLHATIENSNIILSLEGCVFYDSYDELNSGFNLFKINADTKVCEKFEFTLENELYRPVKNNGGIGSFNLFSHLLTQKDLRTTKFTQEFSNWTNDIGTTFTHPYKENILLTDLFVYPNLKEISIQKNEKNLIQTVVSSRKLTEIVKERKYVYVSGEELSGKTTLCKKLITEWRQKGLAPIYITGEDISQTGFSDFQKLLKRSIERQYTSVDFEELIQSPEKMVIVIDNLNSIKLKGKYKWSFLKMLLTHFEYTLMTGAESLYVDELIEDEQNNLSERFYQMQIKECGHALRYEITSKWYRLRDLSNVDEEEILKSIDQATGVITSVIGYNYVPSYPLFILTLLQTLEAGKPHKLASSSYGHYYQSLIYTSLGKYIRNDAFETYNSYLTEFSYWVYVSGGERLDPDTFERFHSSFEEKYLIKMKQESIVYDLIKTNLLTKNAENYISIRYQYIRYYYVAKYFADNIEDIKIQEKIIDLVSKLHLSEAASIVLFICHHTKNAFILNLLIKTAKEQFVEFEPSSIGPDILSINTLVDELPRQTIKDRSIEAHRRDILNKQDEEDEDHSQPKQTNDSNETIEDTDLGARLNTGIKTLEIIGQVLKNHYAAIQGDVKVELVNEAYLIGGRTMAFVLSLLSENLDFWVGAISNHLNKSDLKTNEDISRASKRVVFNIANQFVFSFVKKVSSSLGSEYLEVVFSKLAKGNLNNNFYQLVDFSIAAEFYKSFPEERMNTLSKAFKTNRVAFSILRKIVVDYVYLYPVDYKRKQRIAECLDLSVQTQRLIQDKTKGNG